MKQGTPHKNVWDFDVGRLVVLGVFLDVDLLMSMTNRHDPLTRVVNNYVGEWLFVGTSQVIREVFLLNTNVSLLQKIDLSNF